MYVNGKIIPVVAIPGMGGAGNEEGWRGWIKVWYIWYTARTVINDAMYPHPEQQQ
jgi:hypothetical protein